MIARRTLIAVLAVHGLLGSSASAQSTKAAEEILSRMEKRYASARSYRDEGNVATVFIRGSQKTNLDRPFRTDFVRPNHFHFRFTEGAPDGEDPKLFVLWTEAGPDRVNRWWTVQPDVMPDRLELVAGGGASISGGSSVHVPPLLMPDSFRRGLPAVPKQPVLSDDEEIDGVPCHTILGKTARGEPMTVWIGKEDSLIRKIFVVKDFGDFKAEETTTYQPKVDVPTPTESFRFTPPR